MKKCRILKNYNARISSLSLIIVFMGSVIEGECSIFRDKYRHFRHAIQFPRSAITFWVLSMRVSLCSLLILAKFRGEVKECRNSSRGILLGRFLRFHRSNLWSVGTVESCTSSFLVLILLEYIY